MQHCVDECKKLREKSDEIPKKKVKTTPLVLSDLVNEYPGIITAIGDLNKEELSRIISFKNSRFRREDKINLDVDKSFNDDNDILKTVVDRFCSPDIIDVIVNSLLND